MFAMQSIGALHARLQWSTDQHALHVCSQLIAIRNRGMQTLMIMGVNVDEQ